MLPPEDRPDISYDVVELLSYARPDMYVNGEFIDRCRFSTDRYVRWCVACNSVLKQKGRTELCDTHHLKYKALKRQRERWSNKNSVAVSRRSLVTLFEMARELDRRIGALSRAYNYGTEDLATHLDRAMLATKELLHHINRKIDDPTIPGLDNQPL
ncbi:hypothetical protein [Nocardioides rubriscoriae]|uniref:hypothetical protein n=1 Tax=Nocardioides rubriscoriae TaxID=642762 RepID=UPI0011DF32C9|nr:hypothetical protein [Nocardioides rubriscoriae]